MKKFTHLLFILFLFASMTSSAQILKGSVLLGGGLSANGNKNELTGEEQKSSTFSFYPAIGLAVADNTVVGLRMSYGRSSLKQNFTNAQSTQTTNYYNAGVFYRRYMTLSKKFFLFGEGEVYYAYSKQLQVQPTYKSESNIKTVGLSFYPGVAFAVNRRIHLEAGLNDLLNFSYSTGNSEYTPTPAGNMTNSKSSGFNVQTNVNTSAPLSIGFRFVLGK